MSPPHRSPRAAHRAASVPLLAALTLLSAAPVRALDRFEIQVYDAEVNDPGHFGLEAHVNYTFSGIETPAFPGEVPPDRALRLTLEPSYGVAEWLELGAYVQFLAAPGGVYEYAGNKLRAKLVLPERTQRSLGIPVFLGLNVELAWVPKAIEEHAWSNEFRPIVGWTDGRFLAAVNPIIGYALTGPDRFQPDLEPAAKLAWNTQRGFSLGLEYYASLGAIGEGFLPLDEQEHLAFAVLDLVPPRGQEAGPWELNVGLGAGLTRATAQHVIAKVIFGRGF